MGKRWPAGLGLVAAVGAFSCVRVYDDAAKADTGAHDVSVTPPAGVCDIKYGGYPFVDDLATKIVAALATDCRVKNHFTSLPPDRVAHIRECFALQLGSILQCTRGDARVKYPGPDSKGILCRDMKSSHAGNGLTQADFSAFVGIVDGVLDDAKMEEADVKSVLATFGNATTKKDIVESTAATLSKPSDGCDAGADTGDADATSDGVASPY